MTYEKIIHIDSENTFEPYVALTLRLQRDRSIDDDTVAAIIQNVSANPKFRSAEELTLRLIKEMDLYGIEMTILQPEKPSFEISESFNNIRVTKRNRDFTV